LTPDRELPWLFPREVVEPEHFRQEMAKKFGGAAAAAYGV
jgi:hypothetical protein